MNVVAQAVEGAIVTGAIYGLVAMGFALLFRASKVLSFAQGGSLILGAFLFYSLEKGTELPFVATALITATIVAAFSALMYVVVFARVASRDHFVTSIATIGLAGVLEAGVSVIYGTAPVTLPSVVSDRSFQVLNAVVTTADIVIVAMAAVVVVALVCLLRFSSLGLQMNAVADNVSLSGHLGVSATRIATIAWGLAGGAAALAGVAFSLRHAVDPAGLFNIGIFAFPAIILGGMDSVGGALFGGFLLAILQNLVVIWLGAEWVDVAAFTLMLVFLMFRPSGLFGRAEVVRL